MKIRIEKLVIYVPELTCLDTVFKTVGVMFLEERYQDLKSVAFEFNGQLFTITREMIKNGN